MLNLRGQSSNILGIGSQDDSVLH